jgi:hypothetical protein
MHCSRTSHSRSSKPPSTTRRRPCPCGKPCLALARCSASCCSTQSSRLTASQACQTSSPPRAWSHVRKHPPAHAGVLQARQSGTLTSHGPCPKRPRWFLRNHPQGQQLLARVEKKHHTGKARTLLAQTLARAVSDMLKRKTVFDLALFLRPSESRAGAPRAALDNPGDAPLASPREVVRTRRL